MCKWVKSGANRIDPCMRKEVDSLKMVGVKILACCCGHGKYPKSIVYVNSFDGNIRDLYSGLLVPRKKRFYKRDADGVFFIPEVPLLVFNSELKK